jgi:hypothetical protein
MKSTRLEFEDLSDTSFIVIIIALSGCVCDAFVQVFGRKDFGS